MCEKYIQDGKVAILVSPGFGTGWSTWEGKELAYDKRVVEFWLKHKDDKEFMEDLDSYNDNANKKAAKKQFKEWGYEDVFSEDLRTLFLSGFRLEHRSILPNTMDRNLLKQLVVLTGQRYKEE